MKVINLQQALASFDDHWHPRIAGELNGQFVKLAKIKGEFEWHAHADEDELFYVVKGSMRLHVRDNTHTLNAGEMIIVPRGVEHKPEARDECHIMLFEPKSTVNTGENESERTRHELDWIA